MQYKELFFLSFFKDVISSTHIEYVICLIILSIYKSNFVILHIHLKDCFLD